MLGAPFSSGAPFRGARGRKEEKARRGGGGGGEKTTSLCLNYITPSSCNDSEHACVRKICSQPSPETAHGLLFLFAKDEKGAHFTLTNFFFSLVESEELCFRVSILILSFPFFLTRTPPRENHKHNNNTLYTHDVDGATTPANAVEKQQQLRLEEKLHHY